MAKLSPAMLKELRRFTVVHSITSMNFSTGEALRRRGLLHRYTEHITYTEHASDTVSTGVWPSRKSPMVRHEWWLTTAGRAALQEAGR